MTTLYIVPTPIGNLKDITLRALEVLKSVPIVAAEDTRRARVLLNHFAISPAYLVSYFEHNEHKRIPWLIERMKAGNSVALISDAGTPGISDPGYRLVSKAISENIPVVPLPGPSAVITALSVGGLPTDRFHFLGYLPPKSAQRQQILSEVKHLRGTLVLYESPKRLRLLLEDILIVFGNRKIVIARELTKVYETFLRGYVKDLLKNFPSEVLGEITLLISGTHESPTEPSEAELSESVILLLNEEKLPLKEIAARLAMQYNISRRKVYQIALRLKRMPEESEQEERC